MFRKRKSPARELGDGPLLTPIWRLSISSGRRFRRRRRRRLSSMECRPHRSVCVLPPCGLFFLTAFGGRFWRKSQPFSHTQKRKHLSNPIPHHTISFAQTPFHRWARSKRRSNKLRRPFLNFTTNKTFCDTTSNSPPIAMRLDRKSKSFNTKRKNTS